MHRRETYLDGGQQRLQVFGDVPQRLDGGDGGGGRGEERRAPLQDQVEHLQRHDQGVLLHHGSVPGLNVPLCNRRAPRSFINFSTVRTHTHTKAIGIGY